MPAHHASPRRRTPYSKESIRRALSHHEMDGVVVAHASPPDAPGQTRSQTKWRVRFTNGTDLELTDKEAYVVCVALAAAEAAR